MSAPSPRSQRTARPKRRSRLGTILRITAVTLLAALIALGVWVAVTVASLPDYEQLKSSPNGQMMRFHAADGTVIMSLGPSYGQWLPSDRIPEVMKAAIVSVEDRRFYRHPGIDPVGIGRAGWLAFERRGQGRRLQGASTITQQLARNIFLNNNYSAARKVREMVLALALEWKFSKQEILELYLNRVYFGGGAYGVDAAARKFYGHSGDRLSLAEAAIIAGLVKAPSNYSPSADPVAAVDRARVVIDVMRDAGAISADEAAAANPADVALAPEPRQNSVRYFTDWVLAQLPTLVDNTTDPIEVFTTLDLPLQRAADQAIRANTPAGLQGALVSLDRDGAVRAMVGGKDYVSSIYNRATQAVRQPGSAFKLFVYLAALEAGYKPEQGVVDEPVTIEGWSPRNSSRRYSGNIDLRTAFAFSINTIAAKIGADVGFQTVADMARRFGITTPVNTHPSMVLGTSDVRLIDMTRAFASVSAKGVAVTPYGILRVTTAAGEILYETHPDESRVLVAPFVASEMTDLLQTAVNTGTARAAQIGRPVAGKTGTTSSNKDGWFLGFSSGITTGVWMGRDDAKSVGGLQGGHAPAKAFADYMRIAVAKRPVEPFDTEVVLPEWQLEPDAEAYGQPDGGMVDENGMPIASPSEPATQSAPETAPDAEATDPDAAPRDQQDVEAPQRLDQRWIDGVLRGDQRDRPRERREPPPQDQ